MTRVIDSTTGVPRFILDADARAPQRAGARRASGAHVWASHYYRRLAITDTLIVIAVAFAPISLFGYPRRMLAIALLVAIVWTVALEGYRTRNPRVIGVGPSEYRRVFGASAFTFGALATFALITDAPELRWFFAAAFPVGTLAMVLSRWLWRQWLTSERRKGNYRSRALVVGPLVDVIETSRRIEQNSGAAYLVVGAVLDAHGESSVALGSRRVAVFDSSGSIAQAVRVASADTVIVAGQHSGDNKFVRQLSWSLEETAAELVLSSGLTDVAGPRIHMRPVEGLPLMHVELPTFEGGKHIIKRSFDLVLCSVALIVLAPVFLVIALAVKADSEGPILFRQERVGKDGRTFRMLKFRSMVQTAEQDLAALLESNEGSGVLFKMKSDPRVTRFGALIRKYSLDELPQIFNIMVGDMSIVGPRPSLPREVSLYEAHVNRRLYIKPGLTGLWQISGRSDLSWEESVRLDLYYVENWSLAGDLVIIWRTVKVLLKPHGAY